VIKRFEAAKKIAATEVKLVDGHYSTNPTINFSQVNITLTFLYSYNLNDMVPHVYLEHVCLQETTWKNGTKWAPCSAS
jgi:hypothetical protein